MLQEIMLKTVCGRAIFALTVAGLLLRMITIFSYKRMRNAAENAGKTKRQWVQVLKKRFENYERFGRIGNVEAFVEHYFSRKGILGIPLGFWDKSVFFLSLATLLVGMLGSTSAYFGSGGENIRDGILYLASGMVASLFLMMVHTLGNTREAKRNILVALTDYLSNGRTGRGEEAKKMPDIPTRAEVEALSEAAVTEEERQILSEVLEDYFW